MPTALCTLFILYLFWIDRKQPDRPSAAVWVPMCWMFLAGSRYVTSWLSSRPDFTDASNLSEGSPVDAAVFAALILSGVIILLRRPIDWRRLCYDNWVLLAYFIYCLTSIMWTDEPFMLFKRLLKDMGNPIMALVLLTERRPYEAIDTVFRRLAFLLVPISVLFTRYYPGLGRSYHHDGKIMYTGAGTQKNSLGLICLLSAIPFIWEFLYPRPNAVAFARRHMALTAILFAFVIMLLRLSDSKTALVCLSVVTALMLLGRARLLAGSPNRLFGLLSVSLLSAWLLDQAFGLKDSLLELLGRNPTLTSRTDIWRVVLEFEASPLVGTGFMSFWTGARRDGVQAATGTFIVQAHNGYLEQYLNLGYVGVAFIIAILISGLLKVRAQMARDQAAAMLRLGFLTAAILYNFTEAAFYGVNNMWIMLLLGYLDVPYQFGSKHALEKRPETAVASGFAGMPAFAKGAPVRKGDANIARPLPRREPKRPMSEA